MTNEQIAPEPVSGELKCCPFCGNPARTWDSASSRNKQIVWCQNSVTCGAMIELHEEDQDAVAAWNRRQPLPDDSVARLLAALREIHDLGEGWMHGEDYDGVSGGYVTIAKVINKARDALAEIDRP